MSAGTRTTLKSTRTCGQLPHDWIANLVAFRAAAHPLLGHTDKLRETHNFPYLSGDTLVTPRPDTRGYFGLLQVSSPCGRVDYPITFPIPCAFLPDPLHTKRLEYSRRGVLPSPEP